MYSTNTALSFILHGDYQLKGYFVFQVPNKKRIIWTKEHCFGGGNKRVPTVSHTHVDNCDLQRRWLFQRKPNSTFLIRYSGILYCKCFSSWTTSWRDWFAITITTFRTIMKGLDAILISVQLKKCWKKGQRKNSEFSWGFWVLMGTQKFYFWANFVFVLFR